MKNHNINLIKPLEGYRALAIIAVLLFHLDVPYFSGGYIGVDLFFVISGYIITKNIAEKSLSGEFSLITFYKKRIRRLFPSLFLTILATLIAGYFFLTPFDYEELSKSALFSTLSLANIYFWQSAGYFDTASHMKPLLHMWSLSVEEQFYIIWPTILLGLLFLSRKQKNIIKIGIIGIFIVSSLSATIISFAAPQTAFFWFFFRIYQFIAGAFLVFVPLQKSNTKTKYKIRLHFKSLLNLLGFVCLFIAAVTFDKHSNTLLVGLVSVLTGVLLITSINSKFAESFFGNSTAVWIGQHSYSLYLVHWPIIVFYKYTNGNNLSPSEIIVLAITSVIGAVILRYFVEQPFRVKRVSHKLKGAIYSGITAALFVGVLIIPTAILSKKGFPNRFDQTLSSLLNERYDAKRHSIENRVGDCFLDRQNKIEDLKTFCYTHDSKKRSILVIGSSLAADFYPGLVKNMPNWSIYQITASGCPPYINLEGKDTCSDLRRFIFSDLLENQSFDLVLLGGLHSKATDAAMSQIADFMDFRDINYAILGPRPSFSARPSVLIKNHGKTEGLESYMQSNLTRSPEINFSFSPKSYFSANEALCDESNNCRWYGQDKLYYKDAVHFSVDGSYFVGEDLADWIRENYGSES